jgi:hypothetical protein
VRLLRVRNRLSGQERVVRANRYNFRPHNGNRERARRMRQIIHGQLDVPAETRMAAFDLAMQGHAPKEE